jgi:predicted exporter
MSVRTKLLSLFLSVFLGTFSLISQSSTPVGDVKLYTPYLKVSLPPGESVDYSIDLINNSSEIKNADISVSGIPGSWNYTLKSGAYNLPLPGSCRRP